MSTSDFSLSQWIDPSKDYSINDLKKVAANDPSISKKLLKNFNVETFGILHLDVTDQQALTWLRKKISSERETLNPEQLAKLKTMCKALGKSCQDTNVEQKDSVNLLQSLWRQVKTEYQIFRSDYALISQQKKTINDLKSFRGIDANAACQLYWQTMPHLSKHERSVATAKFVQSGPFEAIIHKTQALSADEKAALQTCARNLYKLNALSHALKDKSLSEESKGIFVSALADVIREQFNKPKIIMRQVKADLHGKELVAAVPTEPKLAESSVAMELVIEAAAIVAAEKRSTHYPTLTQEEAKVKETYTQHIRDTLTNRQDTSRIKQIFISKQMASDDKDAKEISKVKEMLKASPIDTQNVNIVVLDEGQQESLQNIVAEMRTRLKGNLEDAREGTMSNRDLESLLERITKLGSNYQAIFDEITKTLSQIQKTSDPQLGMTLMQFPKLWLFLQDLNSPLLKNMPTPPVSPALLQYLDELNIDKYNASLGNLYLRFFDSTSGNNDTEVFGELEKSLQLQYNPKNPESFVRLHNVLMTAAIVMMEAYPNAAEAVFTFPGLKHTMSLAIPAHYTAFHTKRLIDGMKTASQSVEMSEKQLRALYNLDNMRSSLKIAIEENYWHGTPIPEELTLNLLQAFQKYMTKYKVEDADAKAFLDLMNPPPKAPKAEKKKAT